MLTEVQVLVPERDNDGRPFSRQSWRQLEDLLRFGFGGFTRTVGLTGQWVDDRGTVYRDRSRQYTVGLSSWRQFPRWLKIVEWARIEFRQAAIYIRVSGGAEILS